MNILRRKKLRRETGGLLPFRGATETTQSLLGGRDKDQSRGGEFRIDATLFLKMLRPITVETGAGETKIEKRIWRIGFALGSDHSRGGPGRCVAKTSSIENENGMAPESEFAGDGKSNDSAPDNDDFMHDPAAILHDPPALTFVLL
jgi:hypothetical protein